MSIALEMRGVEEAIRDLQRAFAEFDTLGNDALNGAGVDMTVLAKRIVHVFRGVLQASLHPEGPFAIGNGTLEEIISPEPANYAEYEVARGGEHDYPVLTLEQGEPILDELAQRVGREVIAFIRGGGNG